MPPSTLLRGAALCLLPFACTPLDGRAAADAARVDAPADAAPPPDASTDAPPQPTSDAPVCPRGEAAAVDPRFSLTLAGSVSGGPTTNPNARAARLDPMGNILLAGNCVDCAAPGSGTIAAVWRVDAATLRLDSTFGGAGVAAVTSTTRPVEQWNAVATDAQARIYLGGQAPASSSRPAVIARLLANGRSDPGFGTEGQARIERAQFSPRPDASVVVALHHDDDGTVAAVIDQYPWQRQATRAWALRLDDAGHLDSTFGVGGVRELEDTHGCFDLTRDGADYVFACISLRDRPELRRLDDAGRPAAWSSGAPAEAVHAPGRFIVRTLARDSVGRWIVVGPVSASYSDSHAPVAAARFLADGTHDGSYGTGGATVFLGPRQTFGYSFASASRVGCEDRLLFGADYNAQGVVGVLDAQGRPLEALGDFSNVLLPLRAGSGAVAVEAIVPVPDSQDVVVVISHSPTATTVHRISL